MLYRELKKLITGKAPIDHFYTYKNMRPMVEKFADRGIIQPWQIESETRRLIDKYWEGKKPLNRVKEFFGYYAPRNYKLRRAIIQADRRLRERKGLTFTA